jgi:hypothetical protein
MMNNKAQGLAMLFTGLGLFLFFSVEMGILELGRYNDFAQGIGVGAAIPALCVWVYIWFFMDSDK